MKKIFDGTVEHCICAESCDCDWADWRIWFTTPGSLHHHRRADEQCLSVQKRLAI